MKCPQPYIQYHSEFETSEYGCGRCLACRQLRSKDWAQRIKYHLQDQTQIGDFVTFTFDDTRSKPSESQHLDKTQLQKLFKRIRKHHQISYYACGEYGEKHQRAHYHAIIMRARHSAIDYSKYWTKGNVDVGSVTEASIAYCTGYILKANAIPSGIPKTAKPFHIWSRGIGDQWMTGKTFTEMSREGNIPRRWRALADPKELPDVKFVYPKDTTKGWQKAGRRKELEAFADGRR